MNHLEIKAEYSVKHNGTAIFVRMSEKAIFAVLAGMQVSDSNPSGIDLIVKKFEDNDGAS